MKFADRVEELPPYLFAEIQQEDRRRSGPRASTSSPSASATPTSRRRRTSSTRSTRAADEPANHRYPESEGLPELRQAIADWYERPLRRQPRPGEGGAAADRLEGGHRAHRPLLHRPGRHRARARTRLPGVRDRHDVRRRRDATSCRCTAKRLPARPRRHPGRHRRRGEGALAELPEQPDRRRRGPRLLRAGRALREAVRHRDPATTAPTARSPTTATSRSASSR